MPHLFLEFQDESGEQVTSPAPLTDDELLALLDEAEFAGSKLIPWGSNYSFAVALETNDGRQRLAIYKPRSGEAPLYDFPDGTLFLREVAAYRLSRALGWGLVPPTTIRSGPHGIGSLQIYVEPAEETTDWDPRGFWGACTLDIERLVLFDIIANNADRKLTHCLRDASGKVWGIDHGLTFNEAPKLRTSLWQFVGEEISTPLVTDLAAIANDRATVTVDLEPLLSEREIRAFFTRVERLLETGRYPVLNPRRNVPYGWW